MPAALEPTDKFLSPGTGFRLLYRLVADNVYAPVTYTLGGAASPGASAVTMADGASAALGTTTDAPATGDNATATAIALLKRALQLQTLYAGTAITAAGGLGAGGAGLIGWSSAIAARLGDPNDAVATTDTGAASLVALTKRMLAKLPPSVGLKPSATSLAVVLASDDAQIGTKVAAVAGLGSGGTGIVGWLSQVWQAQSNLSAQLPSTLGTKTAALSLSVSPASDANVAREIYTVTPLSTPTLGVGANFNPLAATPCSMVELINNTAVDIEYRRNALTAYIPVMAGTSRMVQGLTNANQIAIRRIDQSAAIVTIPAEAFAA